MVLALAGAVWGIALATGGVGLLTSLVSRYSPRASEIRLDGVVLAFALALSALVALVLSFLSSVPGEESLAARVIGGTRRTFGTQRGQRLQRGLVIVQVAVSVVLLVGAGLLTRTMMRLADVDSGLLTEQVLTMSVSLLTPTELLTDPSADGAAKQRYSAMRAELVALPGVTAVGVGSPTLLSRSSVRFEVKAEARTLQIREESIGPRRLNAVLIGSFGLLAVLVAAVGIAGVLAFSVSARHNEIGIRMSLGADAARVQRMILGEGGVLLGIGLLVGAAAAFFAARVIRGLLYGVTPWDPATYAVVTVAMAAIGIVACWLPAVRAARIDPAITMRS